MFFNQIISLLFSFDNHSHSIPQTPPETKTSITLNLKLIQVMKNSEDLRYD